MKNKKLQRKIAKMMKIIKMKIIKNKLQLMKIN